MGCEVHRNKFTFNNCILECFVMSYSALWSQYCCGISLGVRLVVSLYHSGEMLSEIYSRASDLAEANGLQ